MDRRDCLSFTSKIAMKRTIYHAARSGERAGFTLVELLIVIAILASLAALLFPVLTQARSSARKAVSISNLRQCGMSLRMYLEDYSGDSILPNPAQVRQVLEIAPTCDPNDYWRQSCSQEFGDPLVGSYAYVGAIKPFDTEDGWQWYKSIPNNNATLLMSIYYSDTKVRSFRGDLVPVELCQLNFSECVIPNRVVRLRLDGSVSTTSVETENKDGGHHLMSWAVLFVSDVMHWK